MSVYAWEYLGSLKAGEEAFVIDGQINTVEPVDTLPDSPDRGTLVAWLQDPDTGLRWVMLYH